MALKNYILKASKLFYGLSKQDVKRLANDLEKIKVLNFLPNGQKMNVLGKIGLKGFKEGKELPLRQPETTSYLGLVLSTSTMLKLF